MRTLVIHPKDASTDFLCDVYEGKKNWTLVNDDRSQAELRSMIREHDRVVMLGHGTPYGLLGFHKFYVDSSFVDLLQGKYCVCVWCNSDKFVDKFRLNGFYSGMVISEVGEAMYCGVAASQAEVDESNSLLARSLNIAIDADDELEVFGGLFASLDAVNPVIEYNRKNFYHSRARQDGQDLVSIVRKIAARCEKDYQRREIADAFGMIADELTVSLRSDAGGYDVEESPEFVRASAKERVLIKGLDVFGTESKLAIWLRNPTQALGWKRPKDLLEDADGQEILMDELGRIEHGIFA